MRRYAWLLDGWRGVRMDSDVVRQRVGIGSEDLNLGAC